MNGPYSTVNEMGEAVYRVSEQVGMRYLSRDFPRTPEGLKEADEHTKKLFRAIREHEKCQTPHS